MKALIKDIWDLRISKLRSSMNEFVKSDSLHAKVNCKNLFFYLIEFKEIHFVVGQ